MKNCDICGTGVWEEVEGYFHLGMLFHLCASCSKAVVVPVKARSEPVDAFRRIEHVAMCTIGPLGWLSSGGDMAVGLMAAVATGAVVGLMRRYRRSVASSVTPKTLMEYGEPIGYITDTYRGPTSFTNCQFIQTLDAVVPEVDETAPYYLTSRMNMDDAFKRRVQKTIEAQPEAKRLYNKMLGRGAADLYALAGAYALTQGKDEMDIYPYDDNGNYIPTPPKVDLSLVQYDMDGYDKLPPLNGDVAKYIDSVLSIEDEDIDHRPTGRSGLSGS